MNTRDGYIKTIRNGITYVLSWNSLGKAIWTSVIDKKYKLQFISSTEKQSVSEIKNFHLSANIEGVHYYLEATTGWANAPDYIKNSAGKRAYYGAWQTNKPEPLQYIPDGDAGYIKSGWGYLTWAKDTFDIHDRLWAAWMNVPTMPARIKIEDDNKVSTVIDGEKYYLSQHPGECDDGSSPCTSKSVGNHHRPLGDGRRWGIWTKQKSNIEEMRIEKI